MFAALPFPLNSIYLLCEVHDRKSIRKELHKELNYASDIFF